MPKKPMSLKEIRQIVSFLSDSNVSLESHNDELQDIIKRLSDEIKFLKKELEEIKEFNNAD